MKKNAIFIIDHLGEIKKVIIDYFKANCVKLIIDYTLLFFDYLLQKSSMYEKIFVELNNFRVGYFLILLHPFGYFMQVFNNNNVAGKSRHNFSSNKNKI